MNFTEYGDSLLVMQFREFYSEVIRMKQRIQQQQSAGVAVAAEEDSSGSAFANEIWQHLVMLYEEQHQAALRIGGEYWPAYEEAGYVMIALADEVFLNLDWDGRFSWNFNLLESRIFQSHIAGEQFFDRLEQLMQKQSPMRIELAKVYLMAISLGFQGKYRGADKGNALGMYRRRLQSYISGNAEALVDASHVVPQAYEHLDAGGDELRKFPAARRWLIALAVVIVVMLGISHLLWHFATLDLERILQQIQ